MTDLSMTNRWAARQPKTVEVSLPKPQPFSAPVLISDCVTPLTGETILSLLWRREQQTPDDAQ